MTDPTINDRIARAVGDPGSLLPRGGDYSESITRWSTRAVLTVLASEFQTAEMVALIQAAVEDAWASPSAKADAVAVKLAAFFGQAAEEQLGEDGCGRCRRAFDPSDNNPFGAARYGESRFCRGCVDRCHESTDAFHECPVCRADDVVRCGCWTSPGNAEGPQRDCPIHGEPTDPS